MWSEVTNAYDSTRGNVTDRQRRRQWLLETYRADVDVFNESGWDRRTIQERDGTRTVPLGEGVPACRCYRCGKLLAIDTLTVDRIVPGCKGGTYRRSNIRPSCGGCANKTGGDLRAEQRRRSVV